jgi:hypothetical protein
MRHHNHEQHPLLKLEFKRRPVGSSAERPLVEVLFKQPSNHGLMGLEERTWARAGGPLHKGVLRTCTQLSRVQKNRVFGISGTP